MSDAPQHPYPVGSLVRHINQEWATTFPTARITSVHPQGDGTFEYGVKAGMIFSERISASNPMARDAMWHSRATILMRRP